MPLAEALRVKTPCTEGWDTMAAHGERARHCVACVRTVHDVAKLTRAEAISLVEARSRGESVCVHLHVRRTDGAILLADGHAFRHEARAEASRFLPFVAAGAAALVACGEALPPAVPELVPVTSPSAPIPRAPIAAAPALPVAPPATPEPASPETPPSTGDSPVVTLEPIKPVSTKASRAAKKAAAKPPQPVYDIVDGGM